MKNNLYMLKNKTYIFFTILTIILGSVSVLFNITSTSSNNIFINYFECITNPFSIASILLITMGITSKTTNEIKNNYNYILRLNNRKTFIKKCIKKIILLITVNLLIVYLIPFIIFLVSNLNKEIVNHDVYNISMIIYLTFFVFKNIILINLLNILLFIFSLISKRLNYLYFLLILYIVISPVNITINKFSFDPSYYFIGVTYSNFTLEVSYTILYISLFYIIIYLLYRSYLKLKIDL